MHTECVNPTAKRFRRKRGIGIMEIVIATMVLGILYMAVSNLQKGNREALLRIRGRDGAITVAQNIIDSLGTLGVSHFSDIALPKDEFGNLLPLDTIKVDRIWLAQAGLGQDSIVVPYTALVTVSPDNTYRAATTSMLLGEDSLLHVFAKQVNVTVKWPFKGDTMSITVSGVIR